MLQAIVVVVLLIACANLANLQLTRVTSRRKELAVRSALGAGGERLVRMVLVESLLLALAGGAIGLGVAVGGLALVRALGLDRSNIGFEFVLDSTALAYTLGAALLAAVVSGLPPVLALLREDLTGAIREAGRQSGGGRRAQRWRGALVVVQLAMSVVLLVGAGLLTKSFYGLLGEGPGFNAGSVWTARTTLGGPRYAARESWPRFQEEALEALRALPGVAEAGITSILPFTSMSDQGSIVMEDYVPPEGAAPPHAQHYSIDDGYLRALGVPFAVGRNFAAHEAEPVVIVDENVADKYWPNGNALGQRLRMADTEAPDRWYTVVGVVAPVKQGNLAQMPTKETVYWHYEQRPRASTVITLRTVVPPAQLAGAIGAAITALDPEVALYDVQTMDDRVASSLGAQRTPMVLALVFAGVAFVVAVIGIYGVLAWAVSQRINEIGLRMALGARAADIGRMILGQGGRLVAIGLVSVLRARSRSAACSRRNSTESARSIPRFSLLTVVGLGGAALVASWLPARRAARIDPLEGIAQGVIGWKRCGKTSSTPGGCSARTSCSRRRRSPR